MAQEWQGITVQHHDGRKGRVVSSWSGFQFMGLHLAVDGGSLVTIHLNSDGPDTGEAGWQWWCDAFDPELGGPRWLALTDHDAPHRSRSIAVEAAA